MRRIPMATALRTRCAERTRATQLVCVCASGTCACYSGNVCGRDDMRHKYKNDSQGWEM